MLSLSIEKFNDVKDWYDSLANVYDELYGEEQNEKVEYILKLLKNMFGNKKFENGLDFGCGTGISTKIIEEYCNNKFGFDISKKMSEKLREKYNDIVIIDDLYSNTEKYNNFFDFITSITVLQDNNNEEINDILNILNAILKDDGILILSVLKRGRDISFWKSILRNYFKILWFDIYNKDYIFILSKKFL